MSFQGNDFVRNQDFSRDRDLGSPNDTIQADKVDDEFDNLAAALSYLRLLIAALEAELAEGIPNAYSKTESDSRYVKAENALVDIGAVRKAGDTMTGPLTLTGKAGAAKGVVTSGTVVFDYADGNVQSITVNGPVTFDFKDLPALGGTMQINFTIQSGAVTVAGQTWWELGAGDKSTSFADLGIAFKTGRPYRLIVEMVAGLRAGILQ